MPIFRDPLDALIADLERSLPVALDAEDYDDVTWTQEDFVAICAYVGVVVARPRDAQRSTPVNSVG